MSRLLSGLRKIVKNPLYSVTVLNSFHLLNWMPDRLFLKLRYRAYMGTRLRLRDPQLFTEKLQWLKLFNRNPEYTKLVDKYELRQYVKEEFGEQYLISLLGVWDNADDVDFSELPEQFVLKCTHDSGGLVICKDKNTLNIAEARKKIKKCLKHNYFWSCREYPYKDVKPRVICEKYMTDDGGEELKDYKVFCFNGEPKYVLVDYDRAYGHKRNIYDTDWKYMSFVMNKYYPDPNVTFDRPAVLDEILDISRRVSKDIPFVRVDFYIVDNNAYIGEVTFFPGTGLLIFEPPEYDAILGGYLRL